jgi:hypothetical protein
MSFSVISSLESDLESAQNESLLLYCLLIMKMVAAEPRIAKAIIEKMTMANVS